ncbi:MAG: hypothetical protein ACKV2U_26365 [Bryobacteraceae bacterium]
MVQAILRFYSYAFQLLISLAVLALGLVATLSDNTTLEIDLLPWSGKELRISLLILGAFGLLSTILAMKGTLRFLFVMWTLGTVYLLGRGIFASSHQFADWPDFRWALFLLSGVIATVLGAWSRLIQPLSRKSSR